MTTDRRLAVTAALLYLVTWITSVAALPLYAQGGRTQVLGGGLLEVILAAAVVGTSVALYPLLRQHGSAGAIGYVALRVLEAGVILIGVTAILTTVAQPASTASPAFAATSGFQLLHDWTFLVGPGLINPINATVLAVLLLRCRLVPRFIPLLGIVGAVLVGGMNLAVMFGLMSAQPVLALPLFAWEICLATTLALRGIASTTSTPVAQLTTV
ncbi:MAG: DUF4386 domain-containing protein [Candidatus Nanopelagicales bacterium]